MNKLCTKCNQFKDLSEFNKLKRTKDGYTTMCKSCLREYFNKYYANHKVTIQKDIRKYYLKNKSKKLKYVIKWRKNNRDKVNKYQRDLYNRNTKHRISENLRTRIRAVLNNTQKSDNTMTLIDCSRKELVAHLEQTAIKNGYVNFNINTYSGQEYHIDHIVPCNDFNLSCSYHQKLCFNYKNLQILSLNDHIIKTNKEKERWNLLI